MTPFLFNWKSTVCGCNAIFCDGIETYTPWDAEHAGWCKIVGEEELRRKLLDVHRAKIGKKFQFTLRRYGRRGVIFHRPNLVRHDSNAPSAEMGFFLHESMGVSLVACSDPEKFADYIASKAARGLTEKMWLEDWKGGTEGYYLFPAELVADPLLCLPLQEANSLFGIHLDPEFVARYKSLRRHTDKLQRKRN